MNQSNALARCTKLSKKQLKRASDEMDEGDDIESTKFLSEKEVEKRRKGRSGVV